MVSPLRHLFALVLLAAPAVMQAQDAPDTTLVLPEVRVEDVRDREVPGTSAVRVTTLDRAALEATQARTVAEVLEARTGLFVRQYGSGALATLSLRGTGSAHTLVLLDGLRVADPQTGQVDLSLLPTVLLERVEVFHGAASARFGADGLGGVVRLGTLAAEGRGRVKMAGSAGAYGERRLGVVASGGAARFSGVAAVEVSQANGDFPYLNETLVPAQEVRRDGADRSLVTLFGRATHRAGRQRLSVAGWYNRAERGLPGPGNASPGEARQWDDHLRLWAGYEVRVPRGTLELKGGVQRTTLRYANPASGTDDTARTRSIELDARARLAWSRRWLVGGGGTVTFDHAALRGGVDRTHLAAFLHGTAAYGRWLFYPALRLDAYAGAGASVLALSPRLGVNVQPLAWPGLHLKASTGRAFRAPTFNERFWQPGGNPDLKAERGWSLDGGLHVRFGGDGHFLEAEATAFATRLSDQIVWFPGFVDAAVQVWQPANLRRVVTRGLELSLGGQLGRPGAGMLDGGLTYSYTDARDRSDPAAASYDAPLRYVPPEQLKGHLGAAWRGLRLGLSGRFVGRRYLTTDGSMHLAPYHIVDVHLQARRTLGPVAATLALSIENLLDRDYAVVRFYPMPPRHGRVRLTLDL